MNLNYHPPQWIRNLMVSNNFYRESVSLLRTLALNRMYYSSDCPTNTISNSIGKVTLIFMGDGRAPHGGLGDRLWGIISAFKISEEMEFEFKINQVHPFHLNTYLVPNKHDWVISPGEIKYDKTSKAFYYGENKSKLNVPKLYRRIKKIGTVEGLHQIHLYNNLHFVNDFADRFQYLFKASPYLENALSASYKACCLKKGEYISSVFRFQNLLGDFTEADFSAMSIVKQQNLIEKCKRALYDLYHQYSKPILVTSDSMKFLHSLDDISYVKYIDGTIAHPDAYKLQKEERDLFIKSFIDLFMISKSERVYSIYSKEMYKESQFAKTAAIIGRIPHYDIFI